MEEVNFDAMTMSELWAYKSDHQISIPTLGDLFTADNVRMDNLGKAWPKDDLEQLPAGRSSFTLVTKQFVEDFRRALEAAVRDPKSRQGFEALRQRIVAMSFQELVKFNSFRNLVGDVQMQELYEPEYTRRLDGVPQNETLQRGGCVMGFTEAYVSDLRQAMIAAVDQKEKDFVNERSS